MTIRLWLSLADCWQCGLSIELTEQMLADGFPQATITTKVPPKPSPKAPQKEVPHRPAQTRPASSKASSQNKKQSLPTTVASKSATMNRLVRRTLSMTPAWLISLLFHFLLLVLLGLLEFSEPQNPRLITLALNVSRPTASQGLLQEDLLTTEVNFDRPLPNRSRMTQKQIARLATAHQEAREISLDPSATPPELATLDRVREQLANSPVERRMLAARDPRLRSEIVKREGGTTFTEAAVARALRWFALHQDNDGAWSLRDFQHAGDCDGRCKNRASIRSRSAATSLVLLPYLGAGQTHLHGKYQDQVATGLRWLLQNQRSDGDLRADSRGNSGMYAHGQATIVLCEAFAMTGDEMLHGPAQRAVDFIVDSQHSGGGWRYEPRQPGDTSVFGWQVMALQSARAAGLKVPDATLFAAQRYLGRVQSAGGTRYAYQRGHRPDHVMTAEALLCRVYLGSTEHDPALRQGVKFLVSDHLPAGGRQSNIYYWYYGTQLVHHVGGKSWDIWNGRIRELLIESQRREGHMAGSWDPRGNHSRTGGRLYETALAACTLEVYYRHAPIFRRLELSK